MATFGNTAFGSGGNNENKNNTNGGKFTLSEDATTFDSITVELRAASGNNCKAKCSLYNSSKQLLTNGTTEEKTLDTGSVYQSVTFNFVGTKPSGSAGDYWIVITGSADAWNKIYLRAETGQSGNTYGSEYTGYSVPDPFNPTETADKRANIYCTYSPAGEALTQNLSDSIALAEAIKFDIGVKPSDALTMTETLASQSTFNVSLADSLALSESIAHAIGIYLTETLDLDEDLSVELAAAIRKILKGAMARKIGQPTPINIGIGM